VGRGRFAHEKLYINTRLVIEVFFVVTSSSSWGRQIRLVGNESLAFFWANERKLGFGFRVNPKP